MDACTDNGLMKQRLIYYFGLSFLNQQTLFNTIMCPAFTAAQTALDQSICGGSCSESQFFFQQFASSKVSKTLFGQTAISNITGNPNFHSQNGAIFEFPVLLELSLVNQSQAVIDQFGGVSYTDKDYSYLFNPNMVPDRSLFNATTLFNLYNLSAFIAQKYPNSQEKVPLDLLQPYTTFLGLKSNEHTLGVINYVGFLSYSIRMPAPKTDPVSYPLYAFAKKVGPLFRNETNTFLSTFSANYFGALAFPILDSFSSCESAYFFLF
jgi:hypothetical protein